MSVDLASLGIWVAFLSVLVVTAVVAGRLAARVFLRATGGRTHH